MRNFTFLFFVIIGYGSSAQSHWESIILAGDSWKFLPAINQPAMDWYTLSFDDGSWTTGNGGIGYGDGDDATVISPVNSLYLRTKFQVTDRSIIDSLILDIDYDDAFVVYLNGAEVLRSSNLLANPPLYNSTVNPLHEAQMYNGGSPERRYIPTKYLQNGTNLLAVQIVNESTNSSDLTSLIFLHGRLKSPSIIYKPTPSWFKEPIEFNISNLPLIIINTHGSAIFDDPKINASLGIIDNPSKSNKISDPFTTVVDNIGIEIRGSSSQMFEKKNYGFETRTSTGENFNISLLGLPLENDWVLHGPYSDKSLMRNGLTYYLGNKTGRWTPHAIFCELFINDDYRGVYLLIEKIKRDNNRVDISKLEPTELSGIDLTGGYILSIDRPEDHWISPIKGMYGRGDVVINYIYPEYATMPELQRQYIKNYVTSFEVALASTTYADPVTGYRAYIDVSSFVDYFLINELNRNVDAYRLSTFFYKDKGEKLTMGPLWDFNLAFGNADYGQAFSTVGWVMDGIGGSDVFPIPFWWARLRTDSYFNSELKRRWLELRNGPYKLENIYHYIDSTSNLLADAQKRNFSRFPVLGVYVWPNYFIGATYQEELNFMKNWIASRIYWMDSQINLITDIQESPIANSFETYAFPNPFSQGVTIQTSILAEATVELHIYNILGQKIYSEVRRSDPGLVEFSLGNDVFGTLSGTFLYDIRVNGSSIRRSKIIKN